MVTSLALDTVAQTTGVLRWYEDNLVQSGRAAAVWALIGFVVTFAIVRTLTRRIHARTPIEESQSEQSPVEQAQVEQAQVEQARGGRRSLVGDISIGGVHVHHQVWGILLLLVTGMLEFRFQPGSPGLEILALLFGAGAALVLDEFALLFYLEDVYWSDEGRSSIDAVLLALAVGAALLLSTSPLGLDASDPDASSLANVTSAIVLNMVFSGICLLKGKLATGVLGVVVPFIAFIGVLRLAKPTSWWARHRYKPKKLARAHERFGPRRTARYDRVRDLLGGKPRS